MKNSSAIEISILASEGYFLYSDETKSDICTILFVDVIQFKVIQFKEVCHLHTSLNCITSCSPELTMHTHTCMCTDCTITMFVSLWKIYMHTIGKNTCLIASLMLVSFSGVTISSIVAWSIEFSSHKM